ncbi:hypothetical protein UFOVP56_45 [uncultured Caudovirales phage]|uniref:Uncharacterized protein n=1 Tax=uncultured Caudovirales phage TaxID=2100421 RepID=A0A6J5TBW0_9CAUD|nr:hypothetical protein UFOVP56_45 [uncultured Caudovirales phage]
MITMTLEELERRAYTLGNTDVAELYGKAHDAAEEVDCVTEELDDANRDLQLSEFKLDDATDRISELEDEAKQREQEIDDLNLELNLAKAMLDDDNIRIQQLKAEGEALKAEVRALKFKLYKVSDHGVAW